MTIRNEHLAGQQPVRNGSWVGIMLWSSCVLLACQAAGEAIHAATALPVPGTILGIGLLVTVLACRGPQQVPAVLPAADALLPYLRLMFVPLGVAAVLRMRAVPETWLPIAAAAPLYHSLPQVRAALAPVLATVAVGAVTAIGAAVALLGAPVFVVHATATKSVTAAVAIAAAAQIGSDPALAAGIAVLTGIAGAVMCTAVLDWCGVHDERACGLAAGTAAHGIGAARLLAVAPTSGAFSSLAMSLTGLLGGVVLPICFAHWAK